jgi:uncharacterized protein (TIGR02186 family)
MQDNPIVSRAWTACFSLMTAVFLLLFSSQALALTCKVVPERVPIGIGYHGTKIIVSGQYAGGQDLIVEVMSPPEKTELKYKGRALGFLWMKLGTMTFENLPSIYLLFSTSAFDELLPPDIQRREEIGYAALKERAVLLSTKKTFDRQRWINEFFRFKEKQNLFIIKHGLIRLDPDRYRLEMEWPYQAPPGDYTVKVLAVKNGSVEGRAVGRIRVEDAGLVRQLSGLAQTRPAIYGLLALFVAVAVGIGVGLVFKRAGGH